MHFALWVISRVHCITKDKILLFLHNIYKGKKECKATIMMVHSISEFSAGVQ